MRDAHLRPRLQKVRLVSSKGPVWTGETRDKPEDCHDDDNGEDCHAGDDGEDGHAGDDDGGDDDEPHPRGPLTAQCRPPNEWNHSAPAGGHGLGAELLVW